MPGGELGSESTAQGKNSQGQLLMELLAERYTQTNAKLQWWKVQTSMEELGQLSREDYTIMITLINSVSYPKADLGKLNFREEACVQ